MSDGVVPTPPDYADLIFTLATPLLEEALGDHMPPEQAAVTALGRRIRAEVRRLYEAGRAQAAADIRTQTMDFCMDGVGRHLVAECARIAEGGGEAAYPNASDLPKD